MADVDLKTQGQKKAEISTANFITAAVLVTFVVVVVAGLMLKGRWSAFELNNKVSAKKAVAVTTLQDDLTAYNNLESTYQTLVEKKEDTLILDSLPTTPDITQLATALDQQASESGVILSNVAADTSGAGKAPATAAAGAIPVNVTLSVSGPYASVMGYLKTIEQSARPMRVTNVGLNGGANSVTAAISLTTFYAPIANVQMTTETVK
jgi:hypothetical protein